MTAIKIIEEVCRTAVSKSGLPELDYSVNPYHGCLHGCIYCYAMDFTKEKEATEAWGNVLFVRKNIHEVLKKELKRLKKGIVALSTITDPYQPMEAKYRLSRKCAELILSNGFFLTIQTKSPLVTIDLDLWKRYREVMDVGMTITTPRNDIAKTIEPNTPSPSARFKAITKLHENGISTWIFLGPIIPGINDSYQDLREVVHMASLSGSRIIFDKYNHYRGSGRLMSVTLGSEKYDHITKELEGGWWNDVSGQISEICRDENVVSVSQKDDWIFERSQRQKDLNQYL